MSGMILFTGVDGEPVYIAPDKVTAVKGRENQTSYVYLVGDGVVIVQGDPKEAVDQLAGSESTSAYWIRKANVAMGNGRPKTASTCADQALTCGASLGDLTSGLTEEALYAWREVGGTG